VKSGASPTPSRPVSPFAASNSLSISAVSAQCFKAAAKASGILGFKVGRTAQLTHSACRSLYVTFPGSQGVHKLLPGCRYYVEGHMRKRCGPLDGSGKYKKSLLTKVACERAYLLLTKTGLPYS